MTLPEVCVQDLIVIAAEPDRRLRRARERVERYVDELEGQTRDMAGLEQQEQRFLSQLSAMLGVSGAARAVIMVATMVVDRRRSGRHRPER